MRLLHKRTIIHCKHLDWKGNAVALPFKLEIHSDIYIFWNIRHRFLFQQGAVSLICWTNNAGAIYHQRVMTFVLGVLRRRLGELRPRPRRRLAAHSPPPAGVARAKVAASWAGPITSANQKVIRHKRRRFILILRRQFLCFRLMCRNCGWHFIVEKDGKHSMFTNISFVYCHCYKMNLKV